jgi:tRNA pseudouridine38-40 synthase
MAEDNTNDKARTAPVRLAFRVSYLGSRFYGSQMQASSRTVEGEFVAACQRLSLFSDWREAGFLAAGRTDRGVHAAGQVIAFSTDAPDRAIGAINAQLPPDCWCTGYSRVPDQFHPRYDAKSRTYRYYFPEPLAGLEEIQRAAQSFIGSHNFTNFARVQDKNPWRTILAVRIGEEGGFTWLEVKAESFLWHQVRCMAAALSSVGYREAGDDSIAKLLECETNKPIQPAPAEGLVLWDTDCGITWSEMPYGERSVRFMDHLIRHHALMKKICGLLREPEIQTEI